jgi:hypothetical protein
VSLYLRIDYKYNYKKIKEKNNINVILIIINISTRSSLEEVNHVKSISQKYGSNRALGNFDRSPNPRTQGKPRTRPMGRVLGGYPWAVGTRSAVYSVK